MSLPMHRLRFAKITNAEKFWAGSKFLILMEQ